MSEGGLKNCFLYIQISPEHYPSVREIDFFKSCYLLNLSLLGHYLYILDVFGKICTCFKQLNMLRMFWTLLTTANNYIYPRNNLKGRNLKHRQTTHNTMSQDSDHQSLAV